MAARALSLQNPRKIRDLDFPRNLRPNDARLTTYFFINARRVPSASPVVSANTVKPQTQAAPPLVPTPGKPDRYCEYPSSRERDERGHRKDAEPRNHRVQDRHIAYRIARGKPKEQTQHEREAARFLEEE
jgi:hypothetical protein